MKLLFITHQFLPHHIGGTELLVHGLAKQWQAQSALHEAEVLTYVEAVSSNFHEYGLRHSNYDDIPVTEVHFNLSRATYLAEAEYHFPLVTELVRQAVRTMKPEVVHVAHALKHSAAILPMLREEGIPTVMTLSDFWPICLRHTLLRSDGSLCETGPQPPLTCVACAKATHGYPGGLDALPPESWQSAAEDAVLGKTDADARLQWDAKALAARPRAIRDALLAADRLIALSEDARRRFIQHGYPESRMEVLHHGIDAPLLAAGRALRESSPIPPPDAASGQALRLVFMASLTPHKGPHILLAAMKLIPSDFPVVLDFYGPDGAGNYAADLRSQAGNDPRIQFHGAIPPSQVGTILAGYHALAMPAQWFENDPLIVKSAFYVGLPVVASRLGSLEEMLVSTGFGWLLPAPDATAWADWIISHGNADAFSALPAPPQVPTVETFAASMFAIYRQLLPS